MNMWIGAAIAVVGGFVGGSIASRIVSKILGASKVPALRESAAPLAGLALAAGVIIGLLVALGFISPDDLDQLGSDAVSFLPKAIAALVIVIGGSVVATFAAGAVEKSLAGMGAVARFGPMITKFAILGGAAIIGAGQTGVDTMVVNIAVAALLFGVAGSLALLTGLGGRKIAGEIAAGRAWRQALQPGDRIIAADVAGTEVDGIVIEVRSTAVEIDVNGATMFVPNSKLLDAVVRRDRPKQADAEAMIDGG